MVAYLQSENAITVLGWVTGTVDEMMSEAHELAAVVGLPPGKYVAVCLSKDAQAMPTAMARSEMIKPGWRRPRRKGAPA